MAIECGLAKCTEAGRHGIGILYVSDQEKHINSAEMSCRKYFQIMSSMDRNGSRDDCQCHDDILAMRYAETFVMRLSKTKF